MYAQVLKKVVLAAICAKFPTGSVPNSRHAGDPEAVESKATDLAVPGGGKFYHHVVWQPCPAETRSSFVYITTSAASAHQRQPAGQVSLRRTTARTAPYRCDRACCVQLGARVALGCAREPDRRRDIEVPWWELDDATAVAMLDGVGNGGVDALAPASASEVLSEEYVGDRPVQPVHVGRRGDCG